MPCRESNVAHKVVMKLAIELENKRHCISMDNYFTSIILFKELLYKGIHVMEIFRNNCIGLSTSLKNIQRFRRSPQSFMDWAMHTSRVISYAIWKDKFLVHQLSIHANLIEAQNPFVL